MILPDYEIERLCRSAAMIVPYNPKLLNPASLDICIGVSMKLRLGIPWLNTLLCRLGISPKWVQKNLTGFRDIDLTPYSVESPYWLLPGDRILVSSDVTFNMPTNITGQFRLKSSRGREFYEHFEAGWIDPGFHDSVLTMELINHDTGPLPIYPGLKMGQMIFQEMVKTPAKPYNVTGRYNNDKAVQQSRG